MDDTNLDDANSSALSALLGDHDLPRGNERGVDLKPFADQLIAIAEQLRKASFEPGSLGSSTRGPWADRSEAQSPPSPVRFPIRHSNKRHQYVQIARDMYAARRQRDEAFGNPDLFGEPAWDIMLDLYIAHVEGKPVSVSSACIGSASPSTTGLRWLGILADHELIVRTHDPDDQRRVLVRLTDAGLAAMDRYLENIPGRAALAG